MDANDNQMQRLWHFSNAETGISPKTTEQNTVPTDTTNTRGRGKEVGRYNREIKKEGKAHHMSFLLQREGRQGGNTGRLLPTPHNTAEIMLACESVKNLATQ